MKTLADIRKRVGLTQREAATKAEIQQSHLATYETGSRTMPDYVAGSLAKVYDFPAVELKRAFWEQRLEKGLKMMGEAGETNEELYIAGLRQVCKSIEKMPISLKAKQILMKESTNE